MIDESKNTPHYLRSNHPFTRIYKLEYTMDDKSKDIVINEIITFCKNDIKINDDIKINEQVIKIKKNNLTDDTNIKKTKKKPIPPLLKIKVWNKYVGDEIGKTKCLCCKTQDIYQASFTCGHIISEFNGGDIKLNNLKPICSSCNSSMGTQNMNEYIEKFGF